jgi:hypothetical protein
MLDQPVRARLDRNGRQVVQVRVHAGYHPDSIVARAGEPLRLVFRRDDDDVCSERVVFSGPRLDRRLDPTGTTTVDLPAQRPGDIRFTCGMGRYRGQIRFVEDHAPSIFARLRNDAARRKQLIPVGGQSIMTAHVHDPASPTANPHAAAGADGGATMSAVRPRWLLPGLLIAIAAGGLVIAGVLSPSVVLYGGLFGGMILMHLGGHGGHGGHGGTDAEPGGHGGGHAGHAVESTSDTGTLSARSSGPKAAGPDFEGKLDDRASTGRHGNETDDHDQHDSHGCH